MSRRKHSKIDKLPPDIKETVEEMIRSDFTYAEIADYIKIQTDIPISTASVCRHARNLNESIETLRMAQENFRCIMEEINRYPDMDTSEGIIRLLSHYVLESIHNTPEDQWKSIKPENLIKQATSLVKAASYKKTWISKTRIFYRQDLSRSKAWFLKLWRKNVPICIRMWQNFSKRKGANRYDICSPRPERQRV